jgi:hypothetical protein
MERGMRTAALVVALVFACTSSSASGAFPNLWKPSGKKAHDPWKKFCGAVLCYDILEVSEEATEDAIKKSYRKLAREWHPDKNPEKGAREKFQKIAKAYEVLSTEGERKKYDHLMQHPDEYRKLYGEYYFKVTAPPSDVTAVLLLLLAIASGIHYTILLQKKTECNKKLLQVCVDGKDKSSGGSSETVSIHNTALERYKNKNGKIPKAKALKSDPVFISIVETVMNEEKVMFSQPAVWDTIGFKLILLPITLLGMLTPKGTVPAKPI